MPTSIVKVFISVEVMKTGSDGSCVMIHKKVTSSGEEVKQQAQL